jgi:hypothetical protein
LQRQLHRSDTLRGGPDIDRIARGRWHADNIQPTTVYCNPAIPPLPERYTPGFI